MIKRRTVYQAEREGRGQYLQDRTGGLFRDRYVLSNKRQEMLNYDMASNLTFLAPDTKPKAQSNGAL
jgi:hypothetical protein